MLGKKVEEVRFQENAVLLEGNQKLFYENLLIASGASPWIPEIEGIDADGISPLRDLGQAQNIISHASTGTDPTIMLLGPAPASRMALERAGLKAADIELFEINEAFSSVVLKAQQELDIDPEKVNVKGGAIAMGHPLGATGSFLLITLLDELERRNLKVGLTTLCVGAGMGTATIIERVES